MPTQFPPRMLTKADLLQLSKGRHRKQSGHQRDDTVTLAISALEPWFPLLRKFGELERIFGIRREEILPLLFPSIEGFNLHQAVPLVLRDLPQVGKCLALLEAARDVLALTSASVTRNDAVRTVDNLIDQLIRQQTFLTDLARQVRLSKGKRKDKPRSWEMIGDIGRSLYAYLNKKIPGQRGKERGKIPASAPRRYKQRALELTAELITLAYRRFFGPEFQFRPGDVRSRIQQRQHGLLSP